MLINMTGWKLYTALLLAFVLGSAVGWVGQRRPSPATAARLEALARQEQKAASVPAASAVFAEHAEHVLALIILRQDRRRAAEEGVAAAPSEAETTLMLDRAHELRRRAASEAEDRQAQTLLDRAVDEASR